MEKPGLRITRRWKDNLAKIRIPRARSHGVNTVNDAWNMLDEISDSVTLKLRDVDITVDKTISVCLL